VRAQSAYIDDDDRLLALDEAAECAAISPHTLRSRLQRGVGPTAYKIGSRWRVKVRDIKTWIEQAKVQRSQSLAKGPQTREAPYEGE
jgi:predicted DNA-binding transcriptional regulator AlpA